MKRFTIEVPAERIEGSQIYEIKAESQEEAFAGIRAGKGTWVEDQFEMTEADMQNLHVIDEEEVSDGLSQTPRLTGRPGEAVPRPPGAGAPCCPSPRGGTGCRVCPLVRQPEPRRPGRRGPPGAGEPAEAGVRAHAVRAGGANGREVPVIPKYYELIETGFTLRQPDRQGLYLLASDETEYEPNHVAIYAEKDELWVHDPLNGAATRWPLNLYHGNLIAPVWKELP